MEGRSLFVSDVDNTLLGDDTALEDFVRWHDSVRTRLLLAYNSGRFVHSVEESIAETLLPEPDAIIGGVGSEIVLTSGEEERLDGWPPRQNEWDGAAVRRLLRADDRLELQPEHLQSEFKVSFYGYDLSDACLENLHARLAANGYRAEIIYSSNRDLDVLPAGTTKGSAAAHLARHWGLPSSQVLVAGDSGNDLTLFQQGFRGIVVDNAHPELKSLAGPLVFQASRPFAAGVLEGLQYWLDSRG